MELSEARYLALGYLELNGLVDRGWHFKFNRNKRRLGVCKQDDRLIELSEHYVLHNERSHVVDTILHEVAHAIVGTSHGHDDVWKSMCIKLGCSPQSCSDTAVMPDGYWQARCPGCLSTFARHRRPRQLRGRYCVECGPDKGQLVFSDIRTVKAPRREQPAPMAASTSVAAATGTTRQLTLKLHFS